VRLADRHYVTSFQLPDLARVCQARAWGERASVGTFMEQSSHPTAMYLNNAPNNQNTLDGRQESTRRRRALYLPLGLMRTQLSF
jgi:hypothetical protein